MAQFVDPEVTKLKFLEELNTFQSVSDVQRRRGIILLESKFPDLYFTFLATGLSPAPIVFAVKINFDNYDLEPLSIAFINPFTYAPLKLSQVLTHFTRSVGAAGQKDFQPLLQQESSNDAYPFLCIPGVREYHKHPAHTGDSWLLHRKVSGEGTLGYLLDKLYQYGTSPISSYTFQIQGMPHFRIQMEYSQLALGMDLLQVPS